eukprot:m.170906 g.170906  ORF g.170906 m.170906 type:complete len:212 (-) comp18273_c0_seq3:81-716(-)
MFLVTHAVCSPPVYLFTHPHPLLLVNLIAPAGDINVDMIKAFKYNQKVAHTFRIRLAAFKKPKKGKKKGDATPAEPITVSSATIYVASVYPEWQEAVLKLLDGKYNATTKTFPDNRELMPELKTMDELKDKKVFKKVMPFISFIRAQMDEHGRDALSHVMPFDEVEVLKANEVYLQKSLELETLTIKPVVDCDNDKLKDDCLPGSPVIVFA